MSRVFQQIKQGELKCSECKRDQFTIGVKSYGQVVYCNHCLHEKVVFDYVHHSHRTIEERSDEDWNEVRKRGEY